MKLPVMPCKQGQESAWDLSSSAGPSCAMKKPAMTLLTAFVTVFLAELGDKTQLATLALAAGGHSRWPLFLGAALALITSSGLAVLVGTELGHVVPAVWLRRGAGVLMIALGALYVLQPA